VPSRLLRKLDGLAVGYAPEWNPPAGTHDRWRRNVQPAVIVHIEKAVPSPHEARGCAIFAGRLRQKIRLSQVAVQRIGLFVEVGTNIGPSRLTLPR